MRLASLLRSPLLKTIQSKVDHYCQFYPSSLTIQHFLDFGREGDAKSSYVFLRKELLVRLSNIMNEMALLPNDLLQMSSVKVVRGWYSTTFEELLQYENVDADEKTCTKFTSDLKNILKRHQTVVETMAEGIMEMKSVPNVQPGIEKSVQYFLDRFYINRISIRMLINQHVLLFGNDIPDSPRYIGALDPACNVVSVVEDAYENSRFLCERYYEACPNLKIEATNAVDSSQQIGVVYVPSHLYHIVFEIFKNAMRAVVEFNGADNKLPDIKVFVVKGKEDLSIKICDRGGGVTRNKVDQLFNYMYSTAPPPSRDGDQAPLAGFGYGLPLSRLYARYFQGDLFLVSMEGYGTDACIYLKALAVDASELLPIYSTSSKRVYQQGIQAPDWSHPQPGQQPSRAFSSNAYALPSLLSQRPNSFGRKPM